MCLNACFLVVGTVWRDYEIQEVFLEEVCTWRWDSRVCGLDTLPALSFSVSFVWIKCDQPVSCSCLQLCCLLNHYWCLTLQNCNSRETLPSLTCSCSWSFFAATEAWLTHLAPTWLYSNRGNVWGNQTPWWARCRHVFSLQISVSSHLWGIWWLNNRQQRLQWCPSELSP